MKALGKDTGGLRSQSDRGREGFPLPSLRTVRAVLPHTALQLAISSSGLASQNMGFFHGEKPKFSEERIGPALMIIQTSSRSPALSSLFAKD